MKNTVITQFIEHAKSAETGVIATLHSASGKVYKILIQPLDLNKNRSIKIQSVELGGEPSENRLACLVLKMNRMEPMLYLIPTLALADPDDFIFKYNKLNAPFEHLSNYEIKVFLNGIRRSTASDGLSEFAFENMIGELT